MRNSWLCSSASTINLCNNLAGVRDCLRLCYNPYNPRIQLLILFSSWYIFPCKLVARIWCYIFINTLIWWVWVFSLPDCWIIWILQGKVTWFIFLRGMTNLAPDHMLDLASCYMTFVCQMITSICPFYHSSCFITSISLSLNQFLCSLIHH